MTCGDGSVGSTTGGRFSPSRSATYNESRRSNSGHQLGSLSPPPGSGASGQWRRGPPPPSSPRRAGWVSPPSPACVQRRRVAMTTTMLTTITAPPMNIVQSGARIASNTAVISHAHTNAKVEIIRRASRESLGLTAAAASPSKTTTFTDAAERPTEDVMAAAPPPDPPDTASRSSILRRAHRPPLNGYRRTARSRPESADGLDTQDIVRTENLPAASKSPATCWVRAPRSADGSARGSIERYPSGRIAPLVRQLSKARHCGGGMDGGSLLRLRSPSRKETWQ